MFLMLIPARTSAKWHMTDGSSPTGSETNTLTYGQLLTLNPSTDD
jgi:hypothetical protein